MLEPNWNAAVLEGKLVGNPRSDYPRDALIDLLKKIATFFKVLLPCGFSQSNTRASKTLRTVVFYVEGCCRCNFYFRMECAIQCDLQGKLTSVVIRVCPRL